jgi:nitroreductase
VDERLARQVVELATRAPSVHNTQPWRFVAGDAALDLYADRSRQLTALDPTGRQLTISCGAALRFAELAVRGLGYSRSTELLPGGDDDHLARLTIGPPAPVDANELALVREVGRRRTVRDRFDGVPLTMSDKDMLDDDARASGAWLQWLESEPERVALAVFTNRADRVEQADRALRAELVHWSRHDDTAEDGIGPSVLPGLPSGLRSSDVPVRDFAAPVADASIADSQHLPLPAERPDLAVLCTGYDWPISWLQAGRALATVWLRATQLQLAASPVGQALDLPWTRRQLQAELDLPGSPQLIVRFGRALLSAPTSPRRPVSDVLEVRPCPRPT